MGRKKKEHNNILTDAELKLMNIIWLLNEATVHQVVEELSEVENYAYNTVSTIMRILEKKGFLVSRKSGRSHIYLPSISKEDYELIGVNHMVDDLFGGTPVALIKRLLGGTKLSGDELAELKELLKDKESE